MNMTLGILFHAIGAFAAGSFYIIFKKVRNWKWETYWLINTFFTGIIMPLFVSILTIDDLFIIFANAPLSSILWTFLFGVCWGLGNLTFGLSMRYLGLSLGMALALGLSAAFGTIVPPLFMGQFPGLIASTSGQVTLGGIGVCLLGIVLAGWAGVSKEKELTGAEKTKYIKEFSLKKGLITAFFSGIMSAGFAFGIQSGKPIAELSVEHGVQDVWKNSAVLIVIMAGGFLTNGIYCLYMNFKNKSLSDYVYSGSASLGLNYLLCSFAGVAAFMEFMFYGMGTTKMGKNDFVSFSIHLALVIVFSTMWGLIFREWKGSSPRTMKLIFAGIFVLIFSTVIMAYGNYLGAFS